MPRPPHPAPQINEALELALQAIDREATPEPMDKAQHSQEEEKEQPAEEQQEEQLGDQPDEGEQEQEQETNEQGESHTEGGEMPNKTDEQKQGEREPIYENVSSTISMHEVDNEQIATMTITTQTQATRRSHRRSIPNKQPSNNNENNQSPNQTNSSSNQNENSTAATSAAIPVPPATSGDVEPYYQVPKATEPYYDAPKHLRPVPVYENIEIFYSGLEISQGSAGTPLGPMEPPKEKPPPPPTESPPPIPVDEGHDDELDGLGSSLGHNTDTWSSDNTYETISNGTRRHLQGQLEPAQPSPPIKRMNSTKRIKKELRNKRSSFLGIETDGDLDDMETYLELTVAPPPDMAQLLQEERRLEKQLYIKAGLCDSSDTG